MLVLLSTPAYVICLRFYLCVIAARRSNNAGFRRLWLLERVLVSLSVAMTSVLRILI